MINKKETTNDTNNIIEYANLYLNYRGYLISIRFYQDDRKTVRIYHRKHGRLKTVRFYKKVNAFNQADFKAFVEKKMSKIAKVLSI